MCAEGARSAWAGHLDAPEGVKRVHPGWVHLVGGMVGVMAPAYAVGREPLKCVLDHAARRPDSWREWVLVQCDPRHPLLSRARPRIFLSPFFLPYLYSLSLSL